jgi:HAD superfamily hydrolase (TIGR01490 family)
VSKRIAFFDFDGTITTKDTLLEFIKFSKGNIAFLLGFAINSPFIIAYKLGVISNQKAKEKVLRFFFRNTPLDKFNQLCNSFCKDVLPALMRPKALEKIQNLVEEGVVVVIVSASPENWIRTWSEKFKAQLISSQLEVVDGKITGRILKKNCHGEVKVRRIREQFDLNEFEIIMAYGDTHGDKPMLQLAKQSFYKPFRD